MPSVTAPPKGLAGAPPPGAGKGSETATAAGETPMRTSGEGPPWTDNTVARLRQLWAEGHSTAEIGRRLGVSKNAVVGKAHRLDLSGRQSPIEPTGLGGPSSPPRRSPVPKLIDIMPLKTCTPASSGPAAWTRPCPTPAKRPSPERRLFAPVGCKPCCWPLGDPGTAAFRFCDQMTLIGKPYCEAHCRIVYTRPRPRAAEDQASDQP